ncbi:FlgB family protein [Aliiroseovarius sp. PTFE2010]
MYEKLDILAMARGLAAHSEARQNAIAQNVANADTPNYRARDVASFQETFQATNHTQLRATRAGHLQATGSTAVSPRIIDEPGPSTPNGNTVSLETEMLKSADVKSAHDRALAVYRSSMNILRTTIGR